MIKYFNIKPVCTILNNPQVNAPLKQVHQVIYNMLVAKDLYNKLYDYIGLWGEIILSLALEIRDSYHRTIGDTPGQAVFRRDVIFNLAQVVDCKVETAKKHLQVNIDNVC